jgi:hypothetical protein
MNIFFNTKTYETIIGQKTYETNRCCHLNYYHGAYPLRGNAPGVSNLLCSHLVGDIK